MVNFCGILKPRKRKKKSYLWIMEIISPKDFKMLCISSWKNTHSAHTRCKALWWTNEINKNPPRWQTLPVDIPSCQTQSTHGHGRATVMGEVGDSGRKKPEFGLHSLNFPILKMRRLLKWDHWCPMIKLSRHHITLSLCLTDMRAHVKKRMT